MDLLDLEEFLEAFSGHRFGSFKRKSDGSGPDHLREAAKSSGDTEENSVIFHLGHVVVLENHLVSSKSIDCFPPGGGHRSEHLRLAMGS